MPTLDINTCSGDVDTCPVLSKCIEYYEFATISADIDPNTSLNVRFLGDFVVACAKGTCFGKNAQNAKMVLRSLIDKSNPEI